MVTLRFNTIVCVLFRMCHSVRTVLLERTSSGSLGCSIVGGCESGFGLVPIFVKTVVPGTPASASGILRFSHELYTSFFFCMIKSLAYCRSGDMILEVNGQTLIDTDHAQAVALLTGAKGHKVMLKLVSWPGTYV